MRKGFFRKWRLHPAERYERAHFYYKKLQKGTSDLSESYVYSILALLFKKQIFEQTKSSRVAWEIWMQFWPKITPDELLS